MANHPLPVIKENYELIGIRDAYLILSNFKTTILNVGVVLRVDPDPYTDPTIYVPLMFLDEIAISTAEQRFGHGDNIRHRHAPKIAGSFRDVEDSERLFPSSFYWRYYLYDNLPNKEYWAVIRRRADQILADWADLA